MPRMKILNRENRLHELAHKKKRKSTKSKYSIINTSCFTKVSSCLSYELLLYPHRHYVVLSFARDLPYIQYTYAPCISDSCSLINKLRGILFLPCYSPLIVFLSRDKYRINYFEHFVRHFFKLLVLMPSRASQKRGCAGQHGERQLCKVNFFLSASSSD